MLNLGEFSRCYFKILKPSGVKIKKSFMLIVELIYINDGVNIKIKSPKKRKTALGLPKYEFVYSKNQAIFPDY